MKKSSFLKFATICVQSKHDGDMHVFGPLRGNVRSFLGRTSEKLPPKTVRLVDNLVKIKVGLFKKFDLLQNHSKSCILIFSAHLPH